MRTLTYYYSQRSPDLTNIISQIRALCEQKNIPFLDICIDENKDLEDRFGGRTPVILVGPYRINFPFELREIEVAINAALSTDPENEYGESKTSHANILSFSKLESFSLWFSKSYIWLISFLLLAFVFISFLAPVLEIKGHPRIASGIYKFYSVFCHQLAYRSYFVGGEQFVYPRELAHIPEKITYEDVTGSSANDIVFSRSFIGNSILGYKIALCERDIAIYLSLAVFGILFQVTRKRIKSLPWYLWFIIALIPIALDGFSQLPGLAQGWPAWLPQRESTPLLRTLTGILFGGGTGWYMYPLMEESMKISRFNLARKKTIIEKLSRQRSI